MTARKVIPGKVNPVSFRIIIFMFFMFAMSSGLVQAQPGKPIMTGGMSLQADLNGNIPKNLSGTPRSGEPKNFGERAGNLWTSIGPYGGNVYDIAVLPEDPNTIIAAANNPYISHDAGATWEYMSELGALGSNQVNVVTAIPGMFYAGGNGLIGKILRSTDGGATWNPVNLPVNSTVTCITVDPTDVNTIFVGISPAWGATQSQVILKTIDAGVNWTLMNTGVLDPSYAIFEIAVNPDNHLEVFAAAGSGLAGGNIIGTQNGGVSWANYSTGLPTNRIFNSVAIKNNIIYMAGGQLFGSQNVGVYKSINHGTNWVLLSASFPVKAVNRIAVCPTNPSKLYAATEGGGIYYSTDAGVNWTFTTSGADNFSGRRITFDPVNPDIIYGGFLSMGVYKSTDAGATWLKSNYGIASIMIRDIAVNPSDPLRMIAAFEADNSGGCLITNDGALSWDVVETMPATRYSAVCYDLGGNIYAWSNGPSTIGQEGVYKSTDNGLTWVNTGPNIGNLFETEVWDIVASKTDTNTLFITGNRFANGWTSQIYQTTNAGGKWTNVYEGPGSSSCKNIAIAASNEQTVYASYWSDNSQGGFLKSTDGGLTWTEINNGISTDARKAFGVGVSATDENLVYGAAGDPFNIYKSADGGNNWSMLDIPILNHDQVNDLMVSPRNPDVIYAASASKGVLLSLDAGSSWEFANNGLPALYINKFSDIYPVDNDYFLLAATFTNSGFKTKLMTPQYGSVNGIITELSTGGPVENAILDFTSENSSYQAVTGATGTYSIPEIISGDYLLTVTRQSYNTVSTNAVIITGQSATFDFALTAPVIVVSTNHVNAYMAPDTTQIVPVTISNNGNGPLSWRNRLVFPDPVGSLIDQFDISSKLPAGTVAYGCEFDGTYLWVVATGPVSGGDHYLCKLDTAGNLINTYPQNVPVWGLRGLCYHDGYLYGGSNEGFYKIDPETGVFTKLFNGTLGLSCIRGLTYIPYLQNFVARDYATNLVIFNESGEILGSMAQPQNLTTVADIVYDPTADCLWLYDRSGTASTSFYQYDLESQSLTGVQIDVPLLSGLTTQRAGGVFLTSLMFPGIVALGAVTNTALPGDKFFAVNLYPQWLTSSPAYGTIQPGQSQTLDLLLNSEGFPVYSQLDATVSIASVGPDVGTINIPVQMNIVSVGIPGNQCTGDNKTRNYPNPFSGQTTFNFTLKTSSTVTIEIFNSVDQTVNTIDAGSLTAGEHQITWNGTDDRGGKLPSGVYFYRLMTSGNISTGKMIKK